MNENTAEALINFIQAIEDFSQSVSAVSGTDAVKDIVVAGEYLKDTLRKDETIP